MGDMLELGKRSKIYHMQIAKMAKENGIEIILGIGKYTKYTIEKAKELGIYGEHFEDFKKLSEKLKEISKENDLILIKGSRKMEMEKLKEYL